MNVNKLLALERQGMTEKDKEMFLHDLQTVINEYMESDKNATIDVARTENGFSICILFTAHRIKNVRTAQ